MKSRRIRVLRAWHGPCGLVATPCSGVTAPLARATATVLRLRRWGCDLNDFSGYTVHYDKDEAPFPFYVAGALSVALIVGSFVIGWQLLFLLGLIALGIAYYNYPLSETYSPCIGANQYGIFIQGLGLIKWRAIDRMDLAEIAVRVLTLHELQIVLNQPLGTALIADWRKVPTYRILMRLPWKMSHNNLIRINLEPLDQSPEDVHRTLVRMWRHYRS